MPEALVLDPYAMWRDALAEVDGAFTTPPALDRPVWGCTHCTPESELRLLGGDPALVSDDLLGHFIREVASHWAEDQYPVLWRRFIPRALRLWGPDGDGADPSYEIGRLGSGGARLADWPVAERAAVEGAFRALLTVAVTSGRPHDWCTELIEGIAHATGAWTPGWTTYTASPAPKPTPEWCASRGAGPSNSSGARWTSSGGTTAIRSTSPAGSPACAPASRRSPRGTPAARTRPTR